MKGTRKAVVLRSALCLFCLGTMGLFAATSADAQVISYAAKFVCGPAVSDADVVRGLYSTAVNIHNPLLKEAVQFTKTAVIAFPERKKERGPISPKVTETLKPNEAMYVDCTDIRLLFGTGVELPRHIEGFLVIETPALDISSDPLDVVAKYTARHRMGTVTTDPNIYDVESIDIEKITPKKVQ